MKHFVLWALMLSLQLLPVASPAAGALPGAAANAPPRFQFLDDLDDEQRQKLRAEARQKEVAAERLRVRQIAKAQAEKAHEGKLAAKHARKAERIAEKQRREAAAAETRRLKLNIKVNRTKQARVARRASRIADKRAQKAIELAAAARVRKAQAEQQRAQAERDRAEAKRLQKHCDGSTTCDASCAESSKKWRVKCEWTTSCCACAQCSLNSTANRFAEALARELGLAQNASRAASRAARGGGGGGRRAKGRGRKRRCIACLPGADEEQAEGADTDSQR